MRVDLVSEHASPLAVLGGVDAGGQNVHVAALATALAAEGATVVVHTRRDDPALETTVLMAPGVVVHHVEAGPAEPLPKDDLLPHMAAFADRLAEVWADDRPDVVHAHFWMSGTAVLSAARPLGLPTAQTFHALGAVKRRYQGMADTSPPERLGIEQAVACGVDLVIATCSDEVRELVRMGVDPASVAVVPCGVDTRWFTPDGPRALDPRTRRLRALCISRLVPRKGVDDVIRALASAPGVELVVAGGPPAPLLDDDPEAVRLLALARDLGVDDRVELLGCAAHDDVPELLRSADVVVCTPWYEPFGIVPLEAMACGVPVIGSAVGGLLDTIVDGVTGLHVPPRDPDALGAALRRLQDDDGLRRRLGSNGRERAVGCYDWARVADGTLRAYERAIAAATRRPTSRFRRASGAERILDLRETVRRSAR